MLYYRDFLMIPGEDQAFVLSALWRALHAYQRSTNAKIVSVPIKYDRLTRQVSLADKKHLADGFRVFAKISNALDIKLAPHIEDAVQVKQIKTCAPSHTHHIAVERVYTQTARQRKKKGKNFINPEFTLFFWNQKNGASFPYYVRISLNKGTCEFESKNTFGCGCVPAELQ